MLKDVPRGLDDVMVDHGAQAKLLYSPAKLNKSFLRFVDRFVVSCIEERSFLAVPCLWDASRPGISGEYIASSLLDLFENNSKDPIGFVTAAVLSD